MLPWPSSQCPQPPPPIHPSFRGDERRGRARLPLCDHGVSSWFTLVYFTNGWGSIRRGGCLVMGRCNKTTRHNAKEKDGGNKSHRMAGLFFFSLSSTFFAVSLLMQQSYNPFFFRPPLSLFPSSPTLPFPQKQPCAAPCAASAKGKKVADNKKKQYSSKKIHDKLPPLLPPSLPPSG